MADTQMNRARAYVNWIEYFFNLMLFSGIMKHKAQDVAGEAQTPTAINKLYSSSSSMKPNPANVPAPSSFDCDGGGGLGAACAGRGCGSMAGA